MFDISDLGLVEMTRKRIGEGLLTGFAHTCPNCDGRGLVVDTPHRVGSLFSMYAVITAEDRRAASSRASGSRSTCSAPPRATRSLVPAVLLVDGDTVLATPDELEGPR